MKKPSKSVDKAFAVISCMGSALLSVTEKTTDYKILATRIDNMMKVYSHQVGREHYEKTSKIIRDIWFDLLENHKTHINEDSVVELINAFGQLMNAKTFDEMLRLPQPPVGNIKLHTPGDFSKICNSALRLEDKLNAAFGTKAYVMHKPKHLKPKKIKRERTKSSKLNKHDKAIIDAAKAKETRMKSIRERIAKARENNEKNSQTVQEDKKSME